MTQARFARSLLAFKSSKLVFEFTALSLFGLFHCQPKLYSKRKRKGRGGRENRQKVKHTLSVL
jgi:hypothetical protein